MNRSTPVRQARRPGEGGVAAVEMLIIIPLALTLIMGSLAVGAAYFMKLNLTEGAREGARHGAATQTGDPLTGVPTNDWLQEIASVATATAGDWETVCVAYSGLRASTVTPSPQGTWALRATNGAGPTYSATPCFTDGRPAAERRVQVQVTNTGPFNNFFGFIQTLSLEGGAVARFERPYTAGDLTAGGS